MLQCGYLNIKLCKLTLDISEYRGFEKRQAISNICHERKPLTLTSNATEHIFQFKLRFG